MTSQEEPTNLTFQEGVRCGWAVGDFFHFINEKNKIQKLYDLLNPTIYDDVFSWNDLSPFFASFFSPWKQSIDTEPRNDDSGTQRITFEHMQPILASKRDER
jgi:hypothetical protein